MNNLRIKSYWLIYHEEENNYSLEVDYGSYSVNYPNVTVDFLSNNMVAFPVTLHTFDPDTKERVQSYSVFEPENKEETEETIQDNIQDKVEENTTVEE